MATTITTTKQYSLLIHEGQAARLLIGPQQLSTPPGITVVESDTLAGFAGLATLGADRLEEFRTTCTELTDEQFAFLAHAIDGGDKPTGDEPPMPPPPPPPPPRDIEEVRAEKLEQLNAAWDAHTGIEVQPGIVLPIDKASIGSNGVSAMVATQLHSDALLIDVRELSVTIPADQVAACMATFQAAYKPISEKWDELLLAIKAASSLDELNQIEIKLS